ncbi:MAG: hypothetical protein FJ138_05340 [Deltaproteobacteria bacterium]|nr:hypothetical protein [Deltaproteobacteria bacterium]
MREGAPAEPEEDPPAAEAAQVTRYAIEELKARLVGGRGWQAELRLSRSVEAEGAPAGALAEWREGARALALRLGAPRAYEDAAVVKQTLLLIENEVECCQQWSAFERDTQNALLSLISSRLRKLQAHIGENLFDQDRVAKLFRRLTRYSSDFRPGFVYALSRDKVPELESWERDERSAWRRLERELMLKVPLPRLPPDQEAALEVLRALTKEGEGAEGFSQRLRDAVGGCLTLGVPPESPHLTDLVLPHLTHLSGKRFKPLRQAQVKLV